MDNQRGPPRLSVSSPSDSTFAIDFAGFFTLLKLIIEDDEGRKTVVPFVREEITIGRQDGNTIRLTERNVSRRHARLLRQNGAVLVEDLGSYNGIRINGEKIQGRAQIHDGDLIQIGDYDLAIQHEGQTQPQPQPPPPPPVLEPPPVPTNGAHPAAAATEQVRPEPIEAAPPPAPPPVPTAASRGASTAIIHVDQVERDRPRQVVEIDAAEAPRLVCTNTEFAGREFACIRSELRVGRTDDNDISIDHRSLSRTHAKIVRESNGEWRVLDMQSANGVSVNGEVYAQATLRPGDTVELGHVKFKFLAPGEQYATRPGDADDDDAPAPRSKARVLVVTALGTAAVVATAAYFVVLRPMMAGPGPATVPPQAAQPPPQAVHVEPAPPAPAPPPAPAVPRIDPQLDEKLKAAKDAIAALDFGKALSTLEPLRADKGLPEDKVKDVQTLFDQATNEQGFQKKLGEASGFLKDGNLDEAEKALAAADATGAFAKEHRDLKTKLAQARAEAARKEAPHPAPPPKPTPAEIASGLYQDARLLMRASKYQGALFKLKQCIETDPTFAECHMLMGACYARMDQPDQGFEQYQVFIKLAPNHPQAGQVREFIKQFEESKRHPNK
jgi:pSer/pThr/pTyr-binding forkhead associated (FHA) protein